MKKILHYVLLGAALATSLSAAAKLKNGTLYGDWQGVCEQNPQSKKEECGLVQLFSVDNEGKKTVMGRVFIRNAAGQANPVGIITLPLGVNLRAGVAIAVDGKEIGRVAYDFCEPVGCNAAFPLDAKTKDAMMKGKELQVATYLANEQVTMPFSLKGMTKGLGEL